jgi:hypothetical protein
MSKPPLADKTKKELLELARRRGIARPDELSKEALVKALSAQPKAAAKAKPAAKNGKHPAKPAKPLAKAAPPAKPIIKPAPPPVKPVLKTESPKPAAKPPTPTSRVEAAIPADKDLSTKSTKPGGHVKDRIVVTARDPYWLHAFWELSVQSVQRAEAALGQEWHGAKPIIRLFDVTSTDTTSTSEAPVRDFVVHGGCSSWYIDVPQPPRSYRADIGYLTRSGRFFPLCRSNVVAPPKAGACEHLEDGGWVDPERPPAEGPPPPTLPDDQFRRPLKETPFGSGAVLPGKLKKFFFDIDAELIVYVKTDPGATVTLQNDAVKLKDGTAVMRFSLPDSRQIIPAVATSADGMEEQTIVLAVERNTKRLDPMIHDLYGDN